MSQERPLSAHPSAVDLTGFAWRQTSLVIGIGGIVMVRVLPQFTGSVAWIVPGLIAIAFAAWLWWQGDRRYRAFLEVTSGEPGRQTPDGKALFAVVVFVWGAGLAALVVLVLLDR